MSKTIPRRRSRTAQPPSKRRRTRITREQLFAYFIVRLMALTALMRLLMPLLRHPIR